MEASHIDEVGESIHMDDSTVEHDEKDMLSRSSGLDNSKPTSGNKATGGEGELVAKGLGKEEDEWAVCTADEDHVPGPKRCVRMLFFFLKV